MADANRPDLTIAGVAISSPDRVVYPEIGLTKLELVRYYEAVAPQLLRHLRRRPVTMIRCPDDWHDCFFQRHIDEAAHYAGVTAVRLPGKDAADPYASVDSVRGLIALVQLGAVEFHGPGVRADRPDSPDRIVMDLDPGAGIEWPEVVRAACGMRDVLAELGLVSFLKTTGGNGLHVVAPIRRTQSGAVIRDFAAALARLFQTTLPDRYTTSVSKARRRGRILVDALRNAPVAVAIEPYAVRARAGAPVALPIDWGEAASVRPEQFTVRTAPEVMRSGADPWATYFEVRQSVTARMLRQVAV